MSTENKVKDINENGREEHCLPDNIDTGWRKIYDLANAELASVVPEGMSEALFCDDMYQAAVFETESGKIYSTVIKDPVDGDRSDEKNILKTMAEAGDTHIKRMLFMWANSAIDFLSYDFAKMIFEADPRNKDALILRNGVNGFVTEPIRGYMVRN